MHEKEEFVKFVDMNGSRGLSQGEKRRNEHSYHRRSFSHDYYNPFIYHIILKKAKGCPDFGRIIGDASIPPGTKGCAEVEESLLGHIIAKQLVHLPYRFPALKLHQFKVMPDHVHFILQVLYKTERHLDDYIDGLKERIAEKYSLRLKKVVEEDKIFEESYCDKPLYDDRSLDSWYVYIQENPHRRAMVMQRKEFFERVHNLRIGDKTYEAYGNMFLFRNPDKYAVKVSRNDSLEEKRKKKEFWFSEMRKGAVLVSPFIAEDELDVKKQAIASGGKIILIQHKAFRPGYKPARELFKLCSEGRLVIVSLGMDEKTPLSREICKEMNELAKELVG